MYKKRCDICSYSTNGKKKICPSCGADLDDEKEKEELEKLKKRINEQIKNMQDNDKQTFN
jgi:transcription initiation factor IIE alpha subunit